MNLKEQKTSAINKVFVFLILSSVLVAAFSGNMEKVSQASFNSAKGAVTLAISLIGIMAFWLGMVRILEAGGLMLKIADLLKPVMTRIFPEVPPDHPAMGAMILNISANMLGLGNAATPFGIKAMGELDKLNPQKGTATNAMCMFLALNTSSVTILPLGVIGVRAAAQATEPASIFLPSILATLASTTVAIIAAKFLAGRGKKNASLEKSYIEENKSTAGLDDINNEAAVETHNKYSHLLVEKDEKVKYFSFVLFFIFLGAIVFQGLQASSLADFFLKELLSNWLMPFLMFGIVLYGLAAGVKIYEALVEGAKQGFEIAIKIIPYLVAILVGIGMFRASSAMSLLEVVLGPVTGLIGMPVDVLPMAIVRPLSGSGAFAVMSSIVEESPDSFSSYLASTMNGSTETTFYVMAVYFGAVGVTKVRHAVVAALLADITGIVASCLFCHLFWQFSN